MQLEEINIIEQHYNEITQLHPRIGLRVNFDLESICEGETTAGLLGSRFGLNVENGEFETAINKLLDLRMKIKGIHLHYSTKTRSMGGKIIMAKKSENIVFCGTGRRKKSIARVRLVEGKGEITVNGQKLDEYFGTEILKVIVKQPLTATNTVSKYDIICRVQGGGYTGQAGAIRHGIARALVEANSEYKPALKSNGFLTRDPRMKERKKYGLKKARRAPQFSKR